MSCSFMAFPRGNLEFDVELSKNRPCWILPAKLETVKLFTVFEGQPVMKGSNAF